MHHLELERGLRRLDLDDRELIPGRETNELRSRGQITAVLERGSAARIREASAQSRQRGRIHPGRDVDVRGEARLEPGVDAVRANHRVALLGANEEIGDELSRSLAEGIVMPA